MPKSKRTETVEVVLLIKRTLPAKPRDDEDDDFVDAVLDLPESLPKLPGFKKCSITLEAFTTRDGKPYPIAD